MAEQLAPFVRGMVAPVRAVSAPGRVFREQAVHPQPVAVAAGMVVLTAASALSLAPYLRRAAAQSLGLDAESTFLRVAVSVNLSVVTPASSAGWSGLAALQIGPAASHRSSLSAFGCRSSATA